MKSEEIAKIAGVSRSTVSRVLNNYTNVPDETRQKVMEVVEKFNYQPNTNARVLAGKSNNTIGIFIVSIADRENPNRLYNNNYFAQFVDAVVECANSRGYYVLVNIIYTENDYNRVSEVFLQKRIDGCIVVGTEKQADKLIGLAKKGCPMALIDYDENEILKNNLINDNLLIINSNDYDGTVAAMEYLIGLGHRDIGLLAGRLSTYSGQQRTNAFFDTMNKHGFTVREECILYGDFLKAKTKTEVDRLIKNGKLPTAIFSSNDDMAITAMDLFREHNIQVPTDISVIGFDNIPLSSLIRPALSTVSTPVYGMMEKAVDELIIKINKTGKGYKNYKFPATMVIRETCTKYSP